MRKLIIILTVISCLGNIQAQVYIDKPIVLTGSSASDRQVENLSEPDTLNKIITALTIQKNSGRFGIASGSDSLSISIPSSIQFYTEGNLVYFQASLANAGPVQLSVNGLPFFPLRVFGVTELKAEDLKPGQIYCAVFSGAEFQLLSPVSNNCKTGYVAINERICMEINERSPALDFWQAVTDCNNDNARLCRWGEWYYACQKTGIGVLNMTGTNWEWTDDAADGNVRIAGRYGCTSTGALGPLNPNAYRCCYNK